MIVNGQKIPHASENKLVTDTITFKCTKTIDQILIHIILVLIMN